MDRGPGGIRPPGPGRVIHPPSPGYPLSGCFPAEPDSVSPGGLQYSRRRESKVAAMKSVVPRIKVEAFNFPHHPRNNAMKSFVQRHAQIVTGVLSGFDRLVLHGVPRLFAYTQGLLKYLCHRRIRLKDFGPPCPGRRRRPACCRWAAGRRCAGRRGPQPPTPPGPADRIP